MKVFLTLALEAGPDGVIVASVDGIRRIVDMPIEQVRLHIATLESPDPHSKDLGRNPKCDGRRLERLHNGWRVVNLEWYREEARRQAELFRKRQWWSEKGTAARRGARRTETETYPEMEMERETERDLREEGSPEGCAPPSAPPAAGAAPKPKQKTRTVKTLLPESFAPNAEHATIARERGVNLVEQFAQFRDWCAANGARKADWNATLRNWLRNDRARGGAARGLGGHRSRNSDVLEYCARKAMGEDV